MSHITCPKCKTRDHTSGYGLAAGPIGAYTFCNTCDGLLEFSPDSTYEPHEQQMALRGLDIHMVKLWGLFNWDCERHVLIDKWYEPAR
jgi:hypothetical protein